MEKTRDFSHPDTPSSSASAFRGRELKVGDLVDNRYKILSIVGAGGYGAVYKVQQVAMRKVLALKTLHPMNMSDTMMLRLRQEAQAASHLEHDNIVGAVDFGLIDGTQPFFVMEYVEGPTLAEYFKERGKLEYDEALDIIIPIFLALGYAHQRGVVHRDIKPSNIILAEGISGEMVPKIFDFGIAKVRVLDESILNLTKTGEMFGTPLYMSPEQAAGTSVDERCDIYSLGCVLFEALTGTPPFRGENAISTIMMHKDMIAPSLKQASLGGEFPQSLERVVARLMEKEPRHRYQSCLEAAEDLIKIQHGEYHRVAAVGSSARKTEQPKKSGNRMLVALVCSGIIGGAALGRLSAGSSLTAGWSGSDVQKAKVASADLAYEPVSRLGRYDEGYFCKDPRQSPREFHFPVSPYIGDIVYWRDNKPNRIRAQGAQNLAKGIFPVLIAQAELLDNPPECARFRANEINGLIWSETLGTDTEQAFGTLFQLDLKAVSLGGSFSERTLALLGMVPHLKWLSLHSIRVPDQGMNRERDLNSDDLARMRNLRNLRVLSLSYAPSYAGVIRALQGGKSLERLRLAGRSVKTAEFKGLGALSSLRTLSVVQTDGLDYSELTKLPHLERLRLGGETFRDKRWLQLKELRALKELSVNLWFIAGKAPNSDQEWRHERALRDQFVRAVKPCLAPGCQITFYDQRSRFADQNDFELWFDPMAEDLSKTL